MKVGDLKDLLHQYPDNFEVLICVDDNNPFYSDIDDEILIGDYYKTQTENIFEAGLTDYYGRLLCSQEGNSIILKPNRLLEPNEIVKHKWEK